MPQDRGGAASKEAGLLRLTEVLLFLAPLAAFIAWRLTSDRGGPSRPVLIGAACVLVVLAGMLAWLSQEHALPPGAAYVPAELRNGAIVPGHAAPQ
jgi:hypothetical protein